MIKYCKLFFFTFLTIPHVIVYEICREHAVINKDLDRWAVCAQTPFKDKISTGRHLIRIATLIWLLTTLKEYRNLFYLRIGFLRYFLFYIRPEPTLYILMKSKDFGAGTFIQHGNFSRVSASHIGENCWINQMVSIGFNSSKTLGFGNPWIGDNVRISTGARVFGPVKVGDNSVVGVGAVVLKSVPANTTVVPSPTMILYQDGNRVDKKL